MDSKPTDSETSSTLGFSPIRLLLLLLEQRQRACDRPCQSSLTSVDLTFQNEEGHAASGCLPRAPLGVALHQWLSRAGL